jgi:hypothetical protein
VDAAAFWILNPADLSKVCEMADQDQVWFHDSSARGYPISNYISIRTDVLLGFSVNALDLEVSAWRPYLQGILILRHDRAEVKDRKTYFNPVHIIGGYMKIADHIVFALPHQWIRFLLLAENFTWKALTIMSLEW